MTRKTPVDNIGYKYGKVVNYNLKSTLYPEAYRKRAHICCIFCKTDQPMWKLRKECLFCGKEIL